MEKYYVSGCRDDGEATVTCDDSEATFWTLYARDEKGLSQGIIDLAFREDAEAALAVYVERDALQEQLSRYSMTPGWADQRQNESKYVRIALGFGAEDEDVAPCDLVEAITALQEQVQTLAAHLHNIALTGTETLSGPDEYPDDREKWYREGVSQIVSLAKNADTDAVIREIGAKAVDAFALAMKLPSTVTPQDAREYSDQLRAGEQP